MSFRLLQISDLHFGTEVEQVLLSLRKSITDLKPLLVVVTGDITQRAAHSHKYDMNQRFDDSSLTSTFSAVDR